MTSPLLTYANGLLLVTSSEAPEIINGRVISVAGTAYVVQCYLKRQDSTGTTTGADYPGINVMPGVSGDSYLYRGYALRYGEAPEDYNLEEGQPSITWTPLTATTKPTWLVEGITCNHKQGLEQVKNCVIERCSGKYGGSNIDDLISNEIGGIPIIVRSGDVIN